MKDLTPLKISLAHATQQGPRPRNEDFVGAATPEGRPGVDRNSGRQRQSVPPGKAILSNPAREIASR